MSENNISRRQFLEVAGGALALYASSPLWLRLGAAGADPAPANGRKLLVVLLCIAAILQRVLPLFGVGWL